jgi:hypothetical protein
MGLLTTLAPPPPAPPPNGDGEPAYDATTGLPLYGADGMPMAGCCCDGAECADACAAGTTPQQIYAFITNVAIDNTCSLMGGEVGGGFSNIRIFSPALLNVGACLEQTGPCIWYGVMDATGHLDAQYWPIPTDCDLAQTHYAYDQILIRVQRMIYPISPYGYRWLMDVWIRTSTGAAAYIYSSNTQLRVFTADYYVSNANCGVGVTMPNLQINTWHGEGGTGTVAPNGCDEELLGSGQGDGLAAAAPEGSETAPPARAPQRASHAPQQPSPRPVPRDEWPAWVRGVASRRKEGEAGVGDTLARLFNPLGAGDAYKAMRKMLGMPCSCERDQERLNTLYPYQT